MPEIGSKRYEMIEKFKWMRRFRFLGTALLFIIYFIVKKINVFHFPLVHFTVLCFVEAFVNQPYPFIIKKVKRLDYLAYANIVLDLILISGIIHFLGGIEFVFFSVVYPLIIIYAGIMISRDACYHTAFMASVAFSVIVALEYFGYIPHVSLFGLEFDGLHQFGIVAGNILFFYFVATLSGYSTTLLTEKSVKLEEERLYSDNILATMVDGLMVFDEKGNLKDLNRAIQKILGYKREELVGQKKMENLCKEGKEKKIQDAIKRVRLEGVVRDLDVEFLNSDGIEVPFRFNASKLKDVLGKPIGIVAVLHEASKEREVDRVKNDFISNII